MSIQVEHYEQASPRDKVQQWLETMWVLNARIDSRTEEIRRLHSRQEGIAQALGGRASGGPRRDWTDVSDRLMDSVAAIAQEIGELQRRRDQIVDAVAQLPEQWQLLIELRYFQGLEWWQVANRMHCGRTTAWEMHVSALDFLAGMQKSEHH